MKTLIAYFSAESGTTARVAREAAEALGADLFEIRPQQPYSPADLRYTNPLARCNLEHFGRKAVPVAGTVTDFASYERIYLGFPIWYGCAPNVVNTFCRCYDWTGKEVAAFATSGGSPIGRTEGKLRPYLPGGTLLGARLVHSGAELTAWAGELG